MRIFPYPYVWGLPPPVIAESRHMTLNVALRLKNQINEIFAGAVRLIKFKTNMRIP